MSSTEKRSTGKHRQLQPMQADGSFQKKKSGAIELQAVAGGLSPRQPLPPISGESGRTQDPPESCHPRNADRSGRTQDPPESSHPPKAVKRTITAEDLLNGMHDLYEMLSEWKTKFGEQTKKYERIAQKFDRFEHVMGSLPVNPQQLQLQERMSTLEEEKIANAKIWLEEKSALIQECDAHKTKYEALCQEYTTHMKANKNYTKLLKKKTGELQESNAKLEETVATLESSNAALDAEVYDLQRTDVECQKPHCVNTRESLKVAQEEAEQHRCTVSTAITHGGDYKRVFSNFEKCMTQSKGLLKELEEHLEDIHARRVLCDIFQTSYNRSKKKVKQEIGSTVDALYSVEAQEKPNMEDTSYAYSLLIHASRLESRKEYLCEQVTDEVYSLYEINPVVESFLKKESLKEVVEIAWSFVTLPVPAVVCQPKKFDKKIHNPEYGFWDAKLKSPLVYTRPVVYRCYDGQLECKGSVGNKNIPAIRSKTITVTPRSPDTAPDIPDDTAPDVPDDTAPDVPDDTGQTESYLGRVTNYVGKKFTALYSDK